MHFFIDFTRILLGMLPYIIHENLDQHNEQRVSISSGLC